MKNELPPPYLITFIIAFLLWQLLTSSIASSEIITGLFVAFIVSLLSAPKVTLLNGMIISISMPIALIKYLAYFVKMLVLANIDVARRVLSYKINIEPQMVQVKTSMESDLGKLLLANSITLTPGTLSVDIIDNQIQVHWLNCPATDIDRATQLIVGEFEVYLKGFVK